MRKILEALALAAENCASLGVLGSVTFAGPDLSACAEPDSADAIIANLPYVTTSEWERLPVHIRKYEPRTALDGGPDGLSIIRQVVPDAWIVLKAGGILLLEIGAEQGDPVTELLEENGFAGIRVIKDLAGMDRIVSSKKTAD